VACECGSGCFGFVFEVGRFVAVVLWEYALGSAFERGYELALASRWDTPFEVEFVKLASNPQ
jgi:hypothetical protein